MKPINKDIVNIYEAYKEIVPSEIAIPQKIRDDAYDAIKDKLDIYTYARLGRRLGKIVGHNPRKKTIYFREFIGFGDRLGDMKEVTANHLTDFE